MTQKPANDRVRVRRSHERGCYDRQTIDAILDAGIVAHVGYVHDGSPVVTPTIHWRRGDYLYWHGSSASRYIRTGKGKDVCVTVTHFDGLVLALSAFHHSANYRSVMVFGVAEPILSESDKVDELEFFIEKLYPDRWRTLRPITRQELKATTILRLPLDVCSAKVRSGPPVNDPDDVAFLAWSGVLDVESRWSDPVSDGDTPADLSVPEHVARLAGQPL